MKFRGFYIKKLNSLIDVAMTTSALTGEMTTTVNGEDRFQLFSLSSGTNPQSYAGEGWIAKMANSSGTDCMYFPKYN